MQKAQLMTGTTVDATVELPAFPNNPRIVKYGACYYYGGDQGGKFGTVLVYQRQTFQDITAATE